jgi:hypothetical protein
MRARPSDPGAERIAFSSTKRVPGQREPVTVMVRSILVVALEESGARVCEECVGRARVRGVCKLFFPFSLLSVFQFVADDFGWEEGPSPH